MSAHEGLMRPLIRLNIEVLQPMPPNAQPLHRAFTGRLAGAMYRAGVVHHFRVVDADGVLWLVPPAWLSQHMRQMAEMAFDPLDAEFLHIIRTVDRDVIWSAIKQVTSAPDALTKKRCLLSFGARTRSWCIDRRRDCLPATGLAPAEGSALTLPR